MIDDAIDHAGAAAEVLGDGPAPDEPQQDIDLDTPILVRIAPGILEGLTTPDGRVLTVRAVTLEPEPLEPDGVLDVYTLTIDATDGPPRIVVTFKGPGAADCSIVGSGGLEAAQTYIAAWLVDRWAHELRDAMLEDAKARAAQRHELIQTTALDIQGRGRSFRA